MTVETQAGLIEALARADYDAVIGTPEAYWVDFKRNPYALDTARGRWELAKDVAAMAEARGGLIVIGYATERHLAEGIEVASEHHPVPKNLVNPQQYRDIVAERVYPHAVDIATHWFPPGADAKGGVFVIEIPPQLEEVKPFLVKKMIDEGDVEFPHFVGFPRRDGDRVVWLRPETIHHQISPGRRASQRALDVLRGPEAPIHEVRERELAATVAAADAEEGAWLSYQTVASHNGNRGDPLLLERVSAILKDPPSLRPGGFNFRSASEPEWVSGGAIEVTGRSMALRVSASAGVVTAVFGANESCLGWALSQHLPEGAPLRINPITLTEYTLEFFRLVDEQLANLFGYANGSPMWPVRVVSRRMKSELIVLDPGPLRGPGIPLTPPGRKHLARSDEWDMEFTTIGDAEVDAFAALVHVYALFGLSSKDVPHTENERVSAEVVRAL